MAQLYKRVKEINKIGKREKIYWDKQTYSSLEDYKEAMKNAKTLYVGNLSFYTSEMQILQVFEMVGVVERIIIGLDRFKKTPCGFCFVEYTKHEDAVKCIQFISGAKVDDRIIRCELDAGFKEGRQYGRGQSGGQVRDDRRSHNDFDPGRGGYGNDIKLPNSRPFRRHHGEDRPREKRRYEESDVENVGHSPKNPRFAMEDDDDFGRD